MIASIPRKRKEPLLKVRRKRKESLLEIKKDEGKEIDGVEMLAATKA